MGAQLGCSSRSHSKILEFLVHFFDALGFRLVPRALLSQPSAFLFSVRGRDLVRIIDPLIEGVDPLRHVFLVTAEKKEPALESKQARVDHSGTAPRILEGTKPAIRGERAQSNGPKVHVADVAVLFLGRRLGRACPLNLFHLRPSRVRGLLRLIVDRRRLCPSFARAHVYEQHSTADDGVAQRNYSGEFTIY
jgi:hypothetical protein